ncbi:MAG TPA: hypothetical protein VGA49_01920 [Patescibacteria group bacterium]
MENFENNPEQNQPERPEQDQQFETILTAAPSDQPDDKRIITGTVRDTIKIAVVVFLIAVSVLEMIQLNKLNKRASADVDSLLYNPKANPIAVANQPQTICGF